MSCSLLTGMTVCVMFASGIHHLASWDQPALSSPSKLHFASCGNTYGDSLLQLLKSPRENIELNSLVDGGATCQPTIDLNRNSYMSMIEEYVSYAAKKAARSASLT